MEDKESTNRDEGGERVSMAKDHYEKTIIHLRWRQTLEAVVSNTICISMEENDPENQLCAYDLAGCLRMFLSRWRKI